MRRIVVLLALAAVTAVPALAQDAAKDQKVDVTGAWEMSVDSPMGAMTMTLDFKQEGETLTGTQVSDFGENPLTGTVKGAEITFTISFDTPDGRMSITHKGQVDGDAITGTADGPMGSINWTAKRKK
ncbi:MAG: hypothetical protein H6Q10_3124 [Acidobacteria bacterium]|nr:hypothetical protein [Acidobacteriota bacterium]